MFYERLVLVGGAGFTSFKAIKSPILKYISINVYRHHLDEVYNSVSSLSTPIELIQSIQAGIVLIEMISLWGGGAID